MPIRTYTSKGEAAPPGVADADLVWGDSFGLADQYGLITTVYDTVAVADRLARLGLGYLDTLSLADAVTLVEMSAHFRSDDFALDDALTLALTLPGDSLAVADRLVLRTGTTDTFRVVDALVAKRLGVFDTVGVGDRFARLVAANLRSDPSATPDNDFQVDAYLHEEQPNTNFGNATELLWDQRTNPGDPLNDFDRLPVWYFDLRNFANFTAFAGGTHSLTFRMRHTGAAGVTSNLQFYCTDQASRFWTESTVTWNNFPDQGTADFTKTINDVGTAYANHSFTLTDAQLNTMLGDVFAMSGLPRGSVIAPQVRIAARQHATENPPVLRMELTR